MEKVTNTDALQIDGASSDEEELEMHKGTAEEAKESEFLQIHNQQMLQLNSQMANMGLGSKATINEKRANQGVKSKLVPFAGNL